MDTERDGEREASDVGEGDTSDDSVAVTAALSVRVTDGERDGDRDDELERVAEMDWESDRAGELEAVGDLLGERDADTDPVLETEAGALLEFEDDGVTER